MPRRVAPWLSGAAAAVLCAASLAATAAPAADRSFAEDRAEIENLLARYVYALDFSDADGYAGVFTPDGVLDWAGGEVKGRQAIHDFVTSGIYNPARNAEEGKWPAASRHFITQMVLEVNGDKAVAHSYWFQATNPTASRGEMKLGMFGTWEDQLERVDGQWLFTRHSIFNEGNGKRHKVGMANPTREGAPVPTPPAPAAAPAPAGK